MAGSVSKSARLVDGPIPVIEVLGAFAVAGDLGMGQPVGHVLRACVIAMRIAQELGCSPSERSDVYFTSLLMHAGCTAGAPEFAAFVAGDDLVALREMCLCDPSSPRDLLGWVGRNIAPKASAPERAQRVLQVLLRGEKVFADHERGCSDVGARIAARLGLSGAVQEALASICETWNGKGPLHLRGEAIPLAARIVNAAMILEVFCEARGLAAATEAAARRCGKSFDPAVAEAFLRVAKDETSWETLPEEDLWQMVARMDPRPAGPILGPRSPDDVAMAFADFGDLKSAGAAAHSRKTAALAEAMAARMGMPPPDLERIRWAALTHDLGQVAVPSAVLDKATPRTAAEQEQFHLHPHHTERILSRVTALRPAAAIAAMHHERLDGQGYPRGLAGAQIPAAARVVALADAFQELTEDRPYRPALDPDAALAALQPEVGPRFDPVCFEALAQELGKAVGRGTARKTWPAGLTEREVEVLGALGKGMTNREIARALVVTEKTVAHHLEHIYNKIGVSSRAGAILWAMEHELLG